MPKNITALDVFEVSFARRPKTGMKFVMLAENVEDGQRILDSLDPTKILEDSHSPPAPQDSVQNVKDLIVEMLREYRSSLNDEMIGMMESIGE